jgi:hypothetical protein
VKSDQLFTGLRDEPGGILNNVRLGVSQADLGMQEAETRAAASGRPRPGRMLFGMPPFFRA